MNTEYPDPKKKLRASSFPVIDSVATFNSILVQLIPGQLNRYLALKFI